AGGGVHGGIGGGYPREGPLPRGGGGPCTLHTSSPAAPPPIRAVDDKGRDVIERIRLVDRQYVDGFPLEPIQGYARRHALTFSVDVADAERVLLLLTGWTDYAFSSDNFAAYQAGLVAQPPSLQVRNPRGGWRTIVEELGIPVGRPQTIAVDVTGKLPSAECGMGNAEGGARSTARASCVVDFRIVTNMRV